MTDTTVADAAELAASAETEAADEAVMSMLQGHVPLTLLCDLTAPEGPQSADILAEEGEPDTRWWEQ